MNINTENTDIEEEDNFIFNHATQGILITNAKGEIVSTNPIMQILFGYAKDELIGQKIEILIPSQYRDAHIGHRDGYAKTPVNRPMGVGKILHGQRKNGTTFPVEISLSNYQSKNGLFIIAFIIDVTEQYLQQENIKKMNSELELTLTEIKKLNENLEKKVEDRTMVLREALNELEKSKNELSVALEKEKELNDMKSRFVSMASHEFRTPLSTVLSSASLILKYKEKEEDDKREKHVLRIKSAVNNLTEILNDFLSIGKLEEGRVVATFTDFNIVKLIEETKAELQMLAKEQQQITYTHVGQQLVYLDKQLLKNIVINLVSNALKFSSDNSKIEITSTVDHLQVSLVIKDNGIGIAEEDQQHLFERFFRGRNVTNIQGTGLGLNIVNKYVELMNGEVSFTSKLNVGTTFKIIFLKKEQKASFNNNDKIMY